MRETKYRTMKPEDNRAFFERIDWKPLCSFIEKEFNVSSKDFRCELVREAINHFTVEWDKNIAAKCGPLAHGLEDARLCSFIAYIRQPVEYDFNLLEKAKAEGRYDVSYEELDATFGSPEVYLTIDVRIRLFHRGSNGIHLFSARYKEKNGWKITMADGSTKVLKTSM